VDDPDQALVMLVRMDANGNARQAAYDCYDWGGGGTMQAAHYWIQGHWEEIQSGAVVDVEFIRGITTAPKQSERITTKYPEL
jgi:hypothetical protein